MKIEITINADYGNEVYLQENKDKLENELLNVIEQFVGKNTYIEYECENAQFDMRTGELVNYNPHPIQRQFNSQYDKEHTSLKQEIPVFVL